MALTKISHSMSSTPGIIDNSDATAITIGSDESTTFSGPIQLTAGALAAAGNAGLSHRSADNKVYLQAGTGGFNILDDQQNTHFAIDSAGVSTFNAGVTATGLTLNTDADSSFSIADGGTNAITMKAAAGDELYIGANDTYAIRVLNDGTNNVVMDNGGGFHVGSLFIHSNRISSGYTADSEDSDIWINYQGYNGGATRFRDFRVGDGKQAQIMFVDGSTKDTLFSGDVTLAKTGADSELTISGNSSYDPVLTLKSDQGAITTEGFQVWYDNSVGDVHLATTYPSDNAAIRFHTRTGVDKVGTGTNERLTIRGDGNVEVPDGYLAAKQPAAIARGVGGWQTSYTANSWNELHSIVAFTQYSNSVGTPWSNSTGRFTAPIAGYYLCSMSIYASNTTARTHGTSYIHPQWAKNGNVNIHGETPYQIYGHDGTAANSYTEGIGRTDIVYCAAGDYITAQVYIYGANWQIYRNYTAISFCLLSAS